MARLRPTAGEIAARHPSVSPDQLAQATQIIAPELARFNESDDSKGGGLRAGGATLVTTLISISVGFVLVCSLISSMLAPGGVVTRLQGLAVVSRSGIEIDPLAILRSDTRCLVAVDRLDRVSDHVAADSGLCSGSQRADSRDEPRTWRAGDWRARYDRASRARRP